MFIIYSHLAWRKVEIGEQTKKTNRTVVEMTFHNLNFFIFPLYFPRATRSTTWKFTHSIWFPFKYLILKAWDRQHLSSWWQTRAVSDLFLTLHHRLSPPFYLFALHQRLYWCLIIKAMMTIHIVSGLRCRRWWCVERLVGSFVGVCFFLECFCLSRNNETQQRLVYCTPYTPTMAPRL